MTLTNKPPVDQVLAGPHGPLRVRVYEPEGPAQAGLVWAHGGAFIVGDLDMPEADQTGRELAAGGIRVVSVEYRLAPLPADWAEEDGRPSRPGVHYPVPSDELMYVLRWARTEFPAPPWSLGGASAGAALAAGAALRLRDAGDPPTSIVLAYPTVHAELPPATAELAAKTAHLDPERRFSPERVLRMNENHIGRPLAEGPSPAFAGGQELTGLPPALIINAELDDLRASGQAFAGELARAGVDVAQVCERGALHGHLNVEGSDLARLSIARIRRWLLTPG